MKKNHQERSPGRHRFFVSFVTIVLGSLLSACSSGLQVRSDSDPAADFSLYHAYNFFYPMGVEGGYNSPIFGEHFRAAIGREMGQRRGRSIRRPGHRVVAVASVPPLGHRVRPGERELDLQPGSNAAPGNRIAPGTLEGVSLSPAASLRDAGVGDSRRHSPHRSGPGSTDPGSPL